jgi:hypothetical protein
MQAGRDRRFKPYIVDIASTSRKRPRLASPLAMPASYLRLNKRTGMHHTSGEIRPTGDCYNVPG